MHEAAATVSNTRRMAPNGPFVSNSSFCYRIDGSVGQINKGDKGHEHDAEDERFNCGASRVCCGVRVEGGISHEKDA